MQNVEPPKYDFTLVPFESENSNAATKPFAIQGTLTRDEARFQITWIVIGPVAEILWPEKSLSLSKQDLLWEKTCAEIFLAEEAHQSYQEWNFSPSGDWNRYSFKSYRERADELAIASKPLTQLIIGTSTAHFSARIETGKNEFLVGISMVLLHQNGLKTYWALAHPNPLRPDFHDRRSFTLKLL